MAVFLPRFEVDMLAYAIDHPAPATIILISGDRDFVYALSVLRLRRYRVVVMAPPSAHKRLGPLASVCVDWKMEVLGLREASTPSILPSAYHKGDLNTIADDVTEAANNSPISSPPNLRAKKSKKPELSKSAPDHLSMQQSPASHSSGAPPVQKSRDSPSDTVQTSSSLPKEAMSPAPKSPLTHATLSLTETGGGGAPTIPETIGCLADGREVPSTGLSEDHRKAAAPQPDLGFSTSARDGEPHAANTTLLQSVTATHETSVPMVEESVKPTPPADSLPLSTFPIHVQGQSEREALVDPAEQTSDLPADSRAGILPSTRSIIQVSEAAISERASCHAQSFWGRCRETWNFLLPQARPSSTTAMTTSLLRSPTPTPSVECCLVTACSTAVSSPADSALVSLASQLEDHEGALLTWSNEATESSIPADTEADTASKTTNSHLPTPVLDDSRPDFAQITTSGDSVSIPSSTEVSGSVEPRVAAVGTVAVNTSSLNISSGLSQVVGHQVVQSTVPGQDVAIFNSLIADLRNRHRSGDTNPKLSSIAVSLIATNPSVYVHAGLPTGKGKIRKLSALAAAAGIVTICEEEGTGKKKANRIRIRLNAGWL